MTVAKAWASKSKMPKFFVLSSVFLTALLGIMYPFVLPFVLLISFSLLGYFAWKERQKGFKPQSDTYKTLEKIKKKRQRTEENKHKHISDQIAYIAEAWSYTKEQERIIEKFLQARAYHESYNKMTASFLPQIIDLIDRCNERERKGCQREVSKRLKDLSNLMKEELQKKKSLNHESLEVGLEVYDELMKK